jgi:serine/threonine-protein kinase
VTDPQAKLAEALTGRYAIDREVGAGGMATVYLASDLKHDRKVALKVLRPELSAALGSERFPREIKFVAQFNHPHILSLYDSGEAQGFLFYVMPYVEGESLRDRLGREKRLPIPDAIRIFKEVADALAYSHARGVVHRDIKPGNVLLSGRHAVVTDFGVAKAVTAAGGDSMTTVGMAVGTPHYMAPEQAMGDANIDQRADIYALGILMYEMLSGRTPFSAETPQGILAAHVMEPPKDIREFRPEVSDALAAIVMRCLAKDPADRWQSADDLMAQLDLIGTSVSGGVTPTTTRRLSGYAGGAPATRRRVVVWIAAVALLLVIAGAWFLTHRGSGRIQRIGVMPIEDISGKDSIFVAAMHDALTNALSRQGKVTVASRSEMMHYKGSSKTTREIAKELQLDAVVEATVFRAGDVMRINVQFTDPVTSRSLWADTYSPNVSNVLAAQDSVVSKIQHGIDSVLVGAKKPGATP